MFKWKHWHSFDPKATRTFQIQCVIWVIVYRRFLPAIKCLGISSRSPETRGWQGQRLDPRKTRESHQCMHLPLISSSLCFSFFLFIIMNKFLQISLPFLQIRPKTANPRPLSFARQNLKQPAQFGGKTADLATLKQSMTKLFIWSILLFLLKYSLLHGFLNPDK